MALVSIAQKSIMNHANALPQTMVKGSLTNLTIDFETRYGKQYSLSKLTTSEYIMDDRFFVFGAGLKFNNKPTEWYSWEELDDVFAAIDWTNTAVIAHNTRFEAAILSWIFGVIPGRWYDTMSMAKGLLPYASASLKNLAIRLWPEDESMRKGDELVQAIDKDFLDEVTEKAIAGYCIQDVDLCYAAFQKMLPSMPPNELDLIDLTINLYAQPALHLDTKMLTNILESEKTLKQETLEKLDVTSTMLASNNQFASLLEEESVPPPFKISKTTGKPTFAFSKADQGFQALLSHPNQRVADLAAGRLIIKSTQTEARSERLLKIAEDHNKLLPVALNYYGAHTGRFSGAEKINIQNFPRGSDLRKSLLAPPGHVLVSCDSSQIEARMLAWLAGETALTNQFKNKEDVYSVFAQRVFGGEIDEITKVQRFIGKTCILGLGYGMGAKRFRETLKQGIGDISADLSLNEANDVVQLYRMTHQRIAGLWRWFSNHIPLMMDYGWEGETYHRNIWPLIKLRPFEITLPNSMSLRYDPKTFSGQTTHGGKITENVIQALARIVLTEHLLNINREYRVAFTVHDEITCIAKEDDAEQCQDFMLEQMRIAPKWAPDLPLDAEASFDRYYSK